MPVEMLDGLPAILPRIGHKAESFVGNAKNLGNLWYFQHYMRQQRGIIRSGRLGAPESDLRTTTSSAWKEDATAIVHARGR